MATFSAPVSSFIKIFNNWGILPFHSRSYDLLFTKFGGARLVFIVLSQLVISLSLIYINLRRLLYWKSPKYYQLGTAVSILNFSLVFILTSGTAYQAIRKRRSLALFFRSVNSASKALPFVSANVSTFRSPHTKLITASSSVYVVVHLAVLYFNIEYFSVESVILGVGWMLQQTFVNFMTIPYLCFVDIVIVYFEKTSSIFHISGDSSAKNVVKGVRIYDNLVNGVSHLNSFYGFTLLNSVAYAFVTVVSELFFVCLKYNAQMHKFFMFLVSAANMTIYLYSLIKSCDSAVEKAQLFSKSLTSRVMNDKTGQLLINPHVAVHFACNKKVEFNVCRCFNLNVQLGCSMVAACVTYLVILLQLQST